MPCSLLRLEASSTLAMCCILFGLLTFLGATLALHQRVSVRQAGKGCLSAYLYEDEA